mmetsp:Transcript_29828/g.41242  ORF Transcript_29828/g.41242 Transcript_29828/m.41242 type:complete len:247 (-) Transcript_29828:236-976(-)
MVNICNYHIPSACSFSRNSCSIDTTPALRSPIFFFVKKINRCRRRIDTSNSHFGSTSLKTSLCKSAHFQRKVEERINKDKLYPQRNASLLMRQHAQHSALSMQTIVRTRSAGPFGRTSLAAAGVGAGASAAAVGPQGSDTLFAWALLALTILLEVSGTTCMKLSNGFERVVPSIFVFVSYMACFSCLTYAMKFWQVSTAYALWSGLGTALTAVIGVIVFKEPMNIMKFTSLSFIVLGVIGLNLAPR